MDILKIEGLTKLYSNGRGINNLSLTVGEGQIYGFLGPNGSGKTTTLKIIMGLLRKDKGQITIDGIDIEEDFETAVRPVGCMFEATSHYGDLTAYENMRQVARYFPEIPHSRIDELLELVGLGRNKKEKVKKFSLGMRQRLSIAEAMYGRPKLLIMDEPFNGLDIEGVIDIRSTMMRMASQERATFLISSHMAAEMEKMCTHVCVIKNGALLGSGEVESLMRLYPSLEEYFVQMTNDPASQQAEPEANS